MAIVVKKVFTNEKMFQCDKCGTTRPYSLSEELSLIQRGSPSWLLLDDSGKALCPACVSAILTAWYNQKDIYNFNLQASEGDSHKRNKSKAIA